MDFQKVLSLILVVLYLLSYFLPWNIMTQTAVQYCILDGLLHLIAEDLVFGGANESWI